MVVGKYGRVLRRDARGRQRLRRDDPQVGIGERRDVRAEIVEARRCVGRDDERVRVVGMIDEVDAGKDLAHRRRECVYEPVIARCARGIYRDDAARREVNAHVAKKLDGRQVKRNVWLAVRVNRNHVVLPGAAQVTAPVVSNRVQVRLGHRKVLLPGGDDRRVEFYAINRHRAVDRRVLACDGAGGESDHQHIARRRAGCKLWRDQKQVPDAVGQHAVGAVRGLVRLPFVHSQQPPAAVVVNDLDEIVERLGFVDQPRRGFDDAGRAKRGEYGNCCKQQSVPQRASAFCFERDAGDRADEERERQRDERAACAEEREQHEHGTEHAEDAAERRERVQFAGGRAAGCDVARAEPNRKWRDAAEQRHRNREQDERAGERHQAESSVECLQRRNRELQERARDVRQNSNRKARPRDDAVERHRARVAVCPSSAEIIAEREINQNQADDVRPDQSRIAEERAEEA